MLVCSFYELSEGAQISLQVGVCVLADPAALEADAASVVIGAQTDQQRRTPVPTASHNAL